MRIRFSHQNMNEQPHGRFGSLLRHGRCWLDLWRWKFHWEWSFLRRGSGTGIQISLSDYDEDALGGHLTLGYLGGLYWGFSDPWLRRITDRWTSRDKAPHEIDQCRICLKPKAPHILGPEADWSHPFIPRTFWMTNGREIGISYFSGNLWINLWNDPMESCSVDPWWWHTSINFADLLFGHARYEEVLISEERVVVPMPEGGYPATVKISEATWRRPRWPRAWDRMIRSEITPDTPIPFPGKGENSWDCGEDATHSMTCSKPTAFEAAMELSRSVMRDRIRYGSGWNYIPEKLRA